MPMPRRRLPIAGDLRAIPAARYGAGSRCFDPVSARLRAVRLLRGRGRGLKAPFPYFGGKLHAAPLLWSRFGADCGNYVEPFFGSGAVWLNRPTEFRGWATVNDLDGNVANVWRSMVHSPEAVAESACWPVNECDLHARHLWLVALRPRLAGAHDRRRGGWRCLERREAHAGCWLLGGLSEAECRDAPGLARPAVHWRRSR